MLLLQVQVQLLLQVLVQVQLQWWSAVQVQDPTAELVVVGGYCW